MNGPIRRSPGESGRRGFRAEALGAAVLLVAIVCILPWGTARANGLSIAVRDSGLDIESRETALVVILRTLAEKTGLSLSLAKPLTEPLSCDLREVTLEEAVRRLLAGHNHALTYRKTPAGRFLPERLIVVGTDPSRQPSSTGGAATAGAPPAPEGPHPNISLKLAWFREQFNGEERLSGHLAATFFYDAAGTGGILITDIAEGSPLRQIGLSAGDVIRNVNGKAVTSAREFLQHLGSLPAAVNFARIERDGKAPPLYLYLE